MNFINNLFRRRIYPEGVLPSGSFFREAVPTKVDLCLVEAGGMAVL